MRKLMTLMLSMIVVFMAHGQNEEKMSREGVVPGTIIKKGKETKGYIKIMGYTYLDDQNYAAPWQFQGKIRFIEKKTFETKEKIKNKDYDKLDAKDIDGYLYNGDSLVYESVKYADMSAVGTGMIPKTKFMRKLVDEKISIYHHFQTPPPVGEVSGLKEIYEENKTPEAVYKIGEKGKLKLVNSLNVEKELSDCPTVVEKYKNNEYKAVGDEESKSKMNKFLNKTIFRDAVRILVIDDYNNTCE